MSLAVAINSYKVEYYLYTVDSEDLTSPPEQSKKSRLPITEEIRRAIEVALYEASRGDYRTLKKIISEYASPYLFEQRLVGDNRLVPK